MELNVAVIRGRYISISRLAVVMHDLSMVIICWVGLHRLRYEWTQVEHNTPWVSIESLIVLTIQSTVFWRMGLYRGLWRFASLPDLINILKATFIGALAISICFLFYNRLDMVSRAVLLIYPVALTMLLALPRFFYRSWKDRSNRQTDNNDIKVLVVGAGGAAEALVRDMRRNSRYQAIGFVDDSPSMRGRSVHGIPVLGRIDDLPRLARETAVGMLVIAIPSADANDMRRIVAMCEQTRLPFRMVPRLQDMLEGKAQPGELKEVSIEDLLGRKPVSTDWNAIRQWLGGRRVLITGGGGSIGSELCRQCARHGAQSIVVVEFDELALNQMVTELRRDHGESLEVIGVLGDCGDSAVMRHAFSLCRIDAVFHAAAYKHVPVLETQVREAVRNNVLASLTVATCSREQEVDTFVLISTDKAVDPSSVLGASKRMAEMACQSLAQPGGTRFVTVRFGNVLDSAGSVVPLFREQIRQGGPVTVTDPEVTRYFMTIPEACVLILQASAIGARQAVYTLDMGEPVRIAQLAEQMIRLAGKTPGKEIAITYTGLRPGEKLHETLFHADEDYRPTSHPKILHANVRPVSKEALEDMLARARAAVDQYDVVALSEVLHAAVPEFSPVSQQHVAQSERDVVIPFPVLPRSRIQ